MKNNLYLIALSILGLTFTAGTASGQLSFTNANNQLPANTRSGCAVTVVDVNNDGLDDIVRLDQGHIINLELQQRDGSFQHHLLTDIGGGSAWAMTMADVDKNGWKDVVADGSNGIRLVKFFENSGVITATNTLLINSGFFLQNATFCDMNNDGWIDLFCCDDNDVSKLYVNDGAGNLMPSQMVNFAVNPGMFYGNDPYDSGNYGSAWIDFDNDRDLDLYVAHCRQSTSSPTDQRRINRLFVNDGNNNFTEQAANFGIDIGWQTWTSSFGDIDNDGDLDLLLTNHDHVNQIFENDGTGNYTELLNTGISNYNITPIESVMEDFDNDGYVDILIAGSEWLYFRNNGNKTFTRVTGLFANNGMLSYAIGDLNHDGFIDVFTSYGDIYQNPSNTYDDVLYLNNRNSNNFITFNLEGTLCEKGAIGARVTIYGPWGIQIREVRAGESYGTCNSFQLHFGLGQSTMVDSAVVWFPSGTTTTLPNLSSNQFVTVVEGTCIVTGNIITGSPIICTGQTTTLNAAAGFTSYNWLDGSTGTSMSVTAAGAYNVLVTDSIGCTNISPNFNVQISPDETPSVAVAGDLVFCEGGSVTLTSSPAAAYTWSNGETTQSITANQTGTYSVTIQGVCGVFTSTTIDVLTLDAPEPVTQGAQGPAPSSLVLTATGNNLTWYDQQTGGNVVGTGPSYTTPLLNTPTTYWVDATTIYPGAIDYTGMTDHSGTQYSGNTTNGALQFTVTSECNLVSAKVYTDTPGDRLVELRDGTTVLQSLLVNVPMGTSRITLNFNLLPGSYSLTTNAGVNNTNFGFNSPRLQRSSSGVTYPYNLPGLVSITGSNQGSSWYYYFYDWEIAAPDYDCVSDRVPALADIITGIGEHTLADRILVYPNPSGHLVNISFENIHASGISLFDVAGRTVKNITMNKINNNKVEVNLLGISAGSYYFRIITDEGTVMKKFTVN